MWGRRVAGDVADVRRADGLVVDLEDAETVVADAGAPDGDVAVTTHAHADHLFDVAPDTVVCSATTAALAETRRPALAGEWTRGDHPRVTLVDAGHVPGSRAALIEGPEETVCYTGDVAVRDRFGLSGFDPPSADVLVVEATYGRPDYRFPPQAALEGAVVDWLDDTAGYPAVLFGYALGRAQELLALAARSGCDGVYATDAVAGVTEVVADACGREFGAERADGDVALGGEDVLVAPGPAAIEPVLGDAEAVTAAFSGWAVDEGYRHRRGVDRAFPLSDHCDFDELLSVVRAVDPDRVYTTHGFAEAFARHVVAETGIEATALKRGQATLDEF